MDFSFAGYRHAEVGVPTVDHKIFNVCDYGAIANDKISDRQALERAIAAAEENGSGVIFFPKGTYELHSAGDPDKSIVISGSNIVFRGEGMGEGGTIINMELDNAPADPKKLYSSPALLKFVSTKGSKSVITNVTGNARKGSFSLEVASAQDIKVGDWVNLTLTNNDPELIAEELSPYSVDNKWTNLTKAGVRITDFHLVTKIEGNTLTFKEPIMRAVDARWGWTINRAPFIEEVGVEGIAFHGHFDESFVHHKNAYHDGGYTMISMQGLVNSWIRDCSFLNVNVAATVGGSACVSVYNCEILGLQGHAAIKSQGSSRVFIGNVKDEPGQWHTYGISNQSMGAVIWRAIGNPGTCFESHASQPRNTLFDACIGGMITGHAGGALQNNPNHLKGLVFWNFKQTNKPEQDFGFWAENSPFWKFVQPTFVGFHHAEGIPSTTFKAAHVLVDESHDAEVYPESLYEMQLINRLGDLPQWLKEIKRDLYTKRGL